MQHIVIQKNVPGHYWEKKRKYSCFMPILYGFFLSTHLGGIQHGEHHCDYKYNNLKQDAVDDASG